jgi:hypothetical protein
MLSLYKNYIYFKIDTKKRHQDIYGQDYQMLFIPDVSQFVIFSRFLLIKV